MWENKVISPDLSGRKPVPNRLRCEDKTAPATQRSERPISKNDSSGLEVATRAKTIIEHPVVQTFCEITQVQRRLFTFSSLFSWNGEVDRGSSLDLLPAAVAAAAAARWLFQLWTHCNPLVLACRGRVTPVPLPLPVPWLQYWPCSHWDCECVCVCMCAEARESGPHLLKVAAHHNIAQHSTAGHGTDRANRLELVALLV
ncbi:hypothetical protein PoB_003010700 [Plakobranchus ocellatus]|uniref:Uncharacterized protein n=1 Tax=Plakobranchus ocellatus TaxID=259542 RepID=A0AAV4A9I4_9GAST|nr:hypothetical protein PoB_003010700 [Plakobranchus ocellatus]